MNDAAEGLRLPRWPLIRWLVSPRGSVPPEVRVALVDSLYGTIPIFIGGVINTVLVSAVIAATIPTPLFIGWAMAEVLLALVRLPVLLACRRAAQKGVRGPTDLYIFLAVCWAVSVGFGSFISIWSGNWAVAALACLSSAAMVGGICFRNFAAPRLVCVMIFASFGPIAVAGITSGEPLMLVTAFQIPLYLYAMTVAAFRMKRMMIDTMRAEIANDHRARHDPLTGLLNRTGLQRAMDARTADERLACFFIDLDGFKRVNDTLGHGAGDKLLEMVAERLRSTAAPGDVIARLGGDEFLIVSPCSGRQAAACRGEAVAAALADIPYIVHSRGVLIGASVGAALRPDQGGSIEELVEAADEALYRAKAAGNSRCVVAGTPALRTFNKFEPEPLAAAG